jgi:hypothetical protein
MSSRWRDRWILIAFAAVSGFFATSLIAPTILPVAGAPRLVQPYGDWVGLHEPAHQAFFRRILDLPFRPDHAWIAVASDDFALFVNGKRVLANRHMLNAALPLHDQLSDPLQGVSIETPSMARSPEIRRGANRERAALQYVDVSPLMRTGANILAVELQSATPEPTFLLMGEVMGEGRSITISGEAQEWRASAMPVHIGSDPWQTSLQFNDGWRTARKVASASESLFAIVAPEVWSQRPPVDALSGPELGGEVRLGRTISGLSWRGVRDGAWLRIASSWPYSLFIDGQLAAIQRVAGNTDVHDVTAFLTRPESRLTVRLIRPSLSAGQAPSPSVAIDGVIDGHLLDPVAGWQALSSDHAEWLEGAGKWQAATRVELSNSQTLVSLQSRSRPDSWTLRFALVWLAISVVIGALVTIAAAVAGALCRNLRSPVRLATAALALPAIAIAAPVLLRLRYKESDTIFWFIDPGNRHIILAIVVAAVGLAFTWVASAGPGKGAAFARMGSRPRILDGELFAQLGLVAIVGLGFMLRVWGLGFEDLQADEGVSLDAARGILRTGVPEAVSGILYTRSPLYHYLLAIWLWVFGDTPEGARSFSVAAGVASIAVVYHFARLMGANRPIALFIALWIAIDPWQITVSRNIRFYQQMQLFGLLSFIFFLKGFILGRDRSGQTRFFIAATAAILSQEVFVIVLPGLCVAGYLYYRPFDLRRDRSIIFGAAAALCITALDLVTFQILCLTPHVGVATSSGSILQLHALNIYAFASTFFSGPLRSHFMAAIAFGLGALVWRKFRSPSLAFGYILVITTVIVATALVVQVANRYLFVIYPVFVTVAVLGLRDIVRFAAEILLPDETWSASRRRWISFMAVPLVAAGVANTEFWRVLGSYGERTVPQHETAYRFIGDHRQPSDVVVTVSPMAGAIVLGGVDYYLMELISFDEIYESRDRGILDRWAGGRLVSNLDMLREVFLKHKRVWIVVDQPEARKMSTEILRYIDAMTKPQLAFFGGEVRLWKREDGLHVHSPDLGRAGSTF